MAYMWYGLTIQDRDPKRALDLFQKALELDPLSPVVNINVAASLRRLGRPQEAAERARRAIEIEPGLGNAYGFLADLSSDELNEPDEAIRFQRKAVEADPGNLGQRNEMAGLLAWLGREDEAIAECRTIIADHPEFAPAYAQMATIFTRKGRLDEALRWQRTAVEKDPESVDALITLFYRYLDLGDEDSAREVGNRVAAKHPEGPAPRAVSYFLHLLHGELGDAEKDARWLLANTPGFFRESVFRFDMRSGRFADARDRYRASNAELFDKSEPHITRENLGTAIHVAAAEMKLGDQEHAKTLLAACDAYIASRGEKTRHTFFRMAPVRIHAVLGKKEEALAAFRRAVDDGERSGWWELSIDPTLDPIRGDPRFAAILEDMRR